MGRQTLWRGMFGVDYVGVHPYTPPPHISPFFLPIFLPFSYLSYLSFFCFFFSLLLGLR